MAEKKDKKNVGKNQKKKKVNKPKKTKMKEK